MQSPDINQSVRRAELQEAQYSFPYHWLPNVEGDTWRIDRYLWWGFRYLALMETVKTLELSKEPTHVLDFGCGDGRLAAELAVSGAQHVVGMDISARAIQFARAFSEDTLSLRFVTDWAGIEGQQFDVVAAMEVLEHINPDHMHEILVRLHSHQPPDGKLVISVPTWQAKLSTKHFRHFSVEEMAETIGQFYRIDQHQYVHANTTFASVLQRCVVNRLFILNHPGLIRQTMKLYRRYVMYADAISGLHLVVVASRQPD